MNGAFARSLPPFLVALLFIAQAATGQTVVSCSDNASTRLRFSVRYDGREWRSTAPEQKRITNRDRVEVCVEHFNFLRYSLKFDVAEQRAESYGYLTKLWESILNPSVAAVLADRSQPRPAADPLVEKLRTLYRLSRDLDSSLGAAAKPYTKTGLTPEEAKTLAAVRGDEKATPQTGIAGQLDVLRRAFRDVDDLILSNDQAFAAIYGERRDMYSAVVDFFRTVDERTQLFLRLSAKATGVEIKPVGKREAGTRVTFTLVALDESSTATPMNDVTYFVQSNMPLVAHGGLSFSGLRDVSFEKVKRSSTFGETELFQQQSDADTTTGFSLFLGWQFYGSGDATTNQRESKVGAAFSLGTDVNKPGKRVFAGPSLLLFNRLVVSGGVVFGKESEGEDSTLEPNLFRLVRERPKAKWFFSLSTKVY